jgi:phage tail sheath protein FI
MAPANRSLRGALALDPAISGRGRASFFDAQINCLEQTPYGFEVLNAATLSGDRDLKLINVRRLLVLLRRLTLREGHQLVFEPNSPSFRRRVERQFQQLLGSLYTRGAFAGATPDEAYRVIADSSVNPPGSVEQGRFIVELRVAPSAPLEFLTVRLVQSGNDTLVAEEV